MQRDTPSEAPDPIPVEKWKPEPETQVIVALIWIVLVVALLFLAGTIVHALGSTYAPGWPGWACLLFGVVVMLLYFCFFFSLGLKIEYAVVCIICSFLLIGMIKMDVGFREMRKQRLERKALLLMLKKGDVSNPIKAGNSP